MREGGQSTTGAARAPARDVLDGRREEKALFAARVGRRLQWARRLFGADDGAAGTSFEELEEAARALPVGAEGCTALETFQGARTPVTDPLARGALYGLTLKHSRAHVWRALLEATALGTRACVDALDGSGTPLRVAGGATRSRLWLQMHADACGRAIVVGESAEAPLLGCAVLVAAGVASTGDVRASSAGVERRP